MQILYNQNQRFQYSYIPNRVYTTIQDSFLKNTLIALDYLYKNDILTVTYASETQKITLDILDALIHEADEPINIKQGDSNKYYPASNTVQFKDTHGVQFRKNYKKRFSGSNIGYNSPLALLSHELIHCYHELFDETGYRKRRVNKSTKGTKLTQHGRDLSFPNKEEELVIRLTNQVVKTLGEDKRGNYGRNYYATQSVLGIEKKNVDKDS
jgi:hypothetical protein